MQSLAFPLRLQENGLLLRNERAASLMALLQIMARTPEGSWPGCPSFGLRDLLEHSRQRADTARLVLQRINESLADLEIRDFKATEVVRELSPGRDTDTYTISVANPETAEGFSAQVGYEP